jgi:ABC-2 type transport system permease protein
LRAVYWKELADFFAARRFVVLLLLIALAGVWAAYNASQVILDEAGQAPTDFVFLRLFTTSRGDSTITFIFFLGIFGPLLGLSLGFNAINEERARGTLTRLLSQPIHRDALINGKFFAAITVLGITILCLVLVIIGVGLYTLGFAPGTDEMARIALFFVATLIYVSVWLALSILFSLAFDRAVVSAMAGLGLWLVLTFFLPFFSTSIAEIVVSEGESPEIVAADRVKWERRIDRLSPASLYRESTQTLLNPQIRTLGLITLEDLEGVLPNPVPLGQSVSLIWPHLTGMLAMLALIFATAYLRFMREEIRP